VAKKFNTDHTSISLLEKDLLETLPDVVAAMDQPTVDGVNTYIISRAANKLPDSLVLKEKMGFTLPFETWMRKGVLRQEVESVLLSPCPALDGLLSESKVQAVWKDFLDGRTAWSRPWGLYVLKKWAFENQGQ
jgi:asparagine synthetase B (glutamine-hydrolysing)